MEIFISAAVLNLLLATDWACREPKKKAVFEEREKNK